MTNDQFCDWIRRDNVYARGIADIAVSERYGTVSIHHKEHKHDPIFMQGDTAMVFFADAEKAWNKSGDTTLDECYGFVARDYIDTLWFHS